MSHERCKFIFIWSHFWSILVSIIPFEQKLLIRTAHHTFLESRHPEVTKNPYYVLSPKGSQKKVSANGLIPVCTGVYIHYFNRINKIVHKHTADYRLSYFYGLIRAFRSRVFLEFSPKPVYSTMVAEKFQIYSIKITANTFVNQKIESFRFYSCP